MSEHVAQEKQFMYLFFFNFTLRPLTLTLRDSGAPKVDLSGLLGIKSLSQLLVKLPLRVPADSPLLEDTV